MTITNLPQPTLPARPQTSARDQMAKRRCTVDFDAPKHGGNARHARPLTRT